MAVGIVEAHAGVGFNLRELGSQLRLHHRGFAQGEAGRAPIGPRQGQHQRRGRGLGFRRGGGQSGAQAGHVERQGLGAAQGGHQARFGGGRLGSRVGREEVGGRPLLGLSHWS